MRENASKCWVNQPPDALKQPSNQRERDLLLRYFTHALGYEGGVRRVTDEIAILLRLLNQALLQSRFLVLLLANVWLWHVPNHVDAVLQEVA